MSDVASRSVYDDLFEAVEAGDAAAVVSLWKKHETTLDIDRLRSRGFSGSEMNALHIAAYQPGPGAVEVIRALVACGANVNARSTNLHENLTPLVWAMRDTTCTENVRALLELGADPHLECTFILTAYLSDEVRTQTILEAARDSQKGNHNGLGCTPEIFELVEQFSSPKVKSALKLS